MLEMRLIMNCILKIKKFVSIFLVLAVMISVTTPNLDFASGNKYDFNPLKKYEKVRIIK